MRAAMMFRCHNARALQITTRAMSTSISASGDTSTEKVSLVQGASRGRTKDQECLFLFSQFSARHFHYGFPRHRHHPPLPFTHFLSTPLTGLGLEFVRQLLDRPGSVVATCRNPSAATDLQLLKEQHRHRLEIIQLDTGNEESIQSAAEQVSELHSHVNLLLNVSGILHIPGVMSPETALNRISMENLQRVFRVNTFGPILVCRGFAPLLIHAGKTSTE
jgi:short chain dehydrogenase